MPCRHGLAHRGRGSRKGVEAPGKAAGMAVAGMRASADDSRSVEVRDRLQLFCYAKPCGMKSWLKTG